jgi:inward rectifier potassium channel
MESPRQRQKLKEFDNSGFSNQVNTQGGRLVNPDGSFNVRRQGMKLSDRFSFYHSLIMMPWWKFALVVLLGFLVSNFIFAQIYIWIGVEGLTGMRGTTPWAIFAEAFFFSTQTLTTVGYGHVSPTSVPIGIVASLESMIGLMGFALATGIMYGRFSGPVARIIFSQGMVVGPYQGITGLMFRLSNVKSNTLSDVTCQLMLSWIQVEDGGNETRRYFNLPMERDTVNSLPLSWTVVHPINEESPIFGLSKEQLMERQAEIMTVIKGYDETSRQVYTARTSYLAHDIEWGAKFPPMFDRTPDSKHTILKLAEISTTIPAALPALQADLFFTKQPSESTTPNQAETSSASTQGAS